MLELCYKDCFLQSYFLLAVPEGNIGICNIRVTDGGNAKCFYSTNYLSYNYILIIYFPVVESDEYYYSSELYCCINVALNKLST
jgi:hypothetical protein